MLTWSSSLEMVAACCVMVAACCVMVAVCCAMVAAETCAYKMYKCIQKPILYKSKILSLEGCITIRAQ